MRVRTAAGLLLIGMLACISTWGQTVPGAAELIDKYVKAVNSGDVESMLGLLAPVDEVTVVVNGRVLVGAEAIRAAWAESDNASGSQRELLALSSLRAEAIEETTILAFATFEIGPTEARPEAGELAMSLLLRRTEDGLKIWHMHASAR